MPEPCSDSIYSGQCAVHAEQRAWLNGFLAGLYSRGEATSAAEPHPR